ncbi:hypothetical protein [Methanobacterium aggregans]|nr:hypothetical protein [Methanobacterium aggregans]MBP2046831.1 hypothetical protein [Methanobacterium aggregans]
MRIWYPVNALNQNIAKQPLHSVDLQKAIKLNGNFLEKNIYPPLIKVKPY